ncbi:MAG TPA: GNAT family N-acetyltransferase, partial [Candidatus Eisenbacteria bacterium]|nr:GNAT family N-acetyltransferase [Candidatus Eisenbacteria bacterium]
GDGRWVMSQGNALVADMAGAIVGCVLLVLPGQAGRQIGADDEAEVRLLAVSPESRGSGTGELLVREVVRRAVEGEFAAVVLSTQTGMKAAQRLYERLGFVRVPGRDWQRGSGAKMLVYRLELPAFTRPS